MINITTDIIIQIISDQSLSRVRFFAIPWIAARQASLSITNFWSSLRCTSIESVMPSSHLILCRPLLLLPQSLPASEPFPMNQLFARGGQSTGVSVLASFLPKNTQTTHNSLPILVTSEKFFSPCKAIYSQVLGIRKWISFLGGSFIHYSFIIGEGNGTPLQYSCLENPMDGGAW